MATEGDNVVVINKERSLRTKWTVIYVDDAKAP